MDSSLDPGAAEIPCPNGSIIQGITFKLDGRHLIGAESLGNLHQWDVDRGGERVGGATPARGNVYAVVTSTDGRWIVSGDTGNKVIVWNAATCGVAVEFSGHQGYVYAVDVSSDSTRVVSGSADCTAQIFNIISGVSVIPPVQHSASVVGVKFSPDGSRIATASHYHTTVGVYDASSGDNLFNVPNVQITWVPTTPLAWSSDGQQLFVASPGKITSFDVITSFRSVWPIQDGENNVSIVIHGQFIACSAGSSISFWNYARRKQIGSVIGHATGVNCLAISHDGRYLACGHNRGITVHSLSHFLSSAYLRVHGVSRVPLMHLSDAVVEPWVLGHLADAERILSEEIRESSNPSHYALAARSLVRAHLREWSTAIEDAEMSYQTEQSPIGRIALSLALVGAGKQEVALDGFDLVFRDGDPSEVMLFLVIKSILVFMCGKHQRAVSRLRDLLTSADETTRKYYIQVLGNMYLKQGDYESAVQTLEFTEAPSTSRDSNPLTTISLIFSWNFDSLKATAWQHLCESLYTSGRTKEVGESLLRMVNLLGEEEKEPAHGRILEAIVTHSGQVTLLSWTGTSSRCNSCLPGSPAVYSQEPFVAPCLTQEELGEQIDELRGVLPPEDALVTFGRLTSSQPVRFVHFRLLLPCIVFGVRRLRREQGDSYRAKTAGLGDVGFTTSDPLPLEEPRRLLFVDTRIHGLIKRHDAPTWEDESVFEADSDSDLEHRTDADTGLTHGQIIEEASTTDTYTRALQLITHLRQPFSALLLLQQSDGTYRRVAAEHEIVVYWTENKVAKSVRVEVLEIV